jgi:hypothetical protein
MKSTDLSFEKAMEAIYRTANDQGTKYMYLFGDANLNERIVALGYKSERLRDGMYYITWGIDKRFVTSPAE